MDAIRILTDAAAAGDREALAELSRLARSAPQIKRAPGVEYRVLPASLSVKAEGRRIIGYGSTFEPADRYDSYGDIIRPGAFAASLARHKSNGTQVLMHNEHLDPVGVWDVVAEDVDGALGGKSGLYVEGEPLPTTIGEDMLTLIRGGIQTGLSIGFTNTVARYLDGFEGRPLHMTQWGYPVREIVELELVEVSVVSRPANPYAEILEVRRARRALQLAPPLDIAAIDTLQALASAARLHALCAAANTSAKGTDQ